MPTLNQNQYANRTELKDSRDRSYLIRLSHWNENIAEPTEFDKIKTIVFDTVSPSGNKFSAGDTLTNTTQTGTATVLEVYQETSKMIVDLLTGAFADNDDFGNGTTTAKVNGTPLDTLNERLDIALKGASDQMDGFLMGKVATPVSPAPDYFKDDCLCIAVMVLIKRKGYQEGTADESAVKDGEKCIKKYEMISQGKLDLSLPDTTGVAPAATKFLSQSPDTIFTEKTLNKYF